MFCVVITLASLPISRTSRTQKKDIGCRAQCEFSDGPSSESRPCGSYCAKITRDQTNHRGAGNWRGPVFKRWTGYTVAPEMNAVRPPRTLHDSCSGVARRTAVRALVVTRAGEAGQSATPPQPPAARAESAEPAAAPVRLRRSAAPCALRPSSPATRRTGSRCAPCASRRRSGSTASSTRRSIRASRRCRISSRWSRRGRRPRPNRPRRG